MFNEEILIDRNALEEECSMAPAFFDFWQNQEINLKIERENAEAELELKVRKMHDEELKMAYGVSKLTEGAINTIIRSDMVIQSLKRRHLSAESSRRSFEKKIAMLDVLARLHGQAYFSKIESKRDTRALLAKHVKEKIKEAIESQHADKKQKIDKPKRPNK